MRILIVGSGSREHAFARAFARASIPPTIFCCGASNNPGIRALAEEYWQGSIEVDNVVRLAQDWQINLAIIGPEAPLEKGLVDALEHVGISSVGPKKALARLETSKRFTRELLEKYQIEGSPRYRAFSTTAGMMQFLLELGFQGYVIKADGLMGGKGVKVAGDHLHSVDEGLEYASGLIDQGQAVVIEERLIGQEFSLLCFCDGVNLFPMPLVQDHKRAFVNDVGPNTGGMGSYSDANHSLPFLEPSDVEAALAINRQVITAVTEECGEPYRGILYGSFMATSDGVKLIEYNARFGDPEALNVLAILESDFLRLCQSLVSGCIKFDEVRFKPLATVCKYAVPYGYPDKPKKNIIVDISKVVDKEVLYFGAIDDVDGRLYAQGSRALAVVGVAPTIEQAERIAEHEINRVGGQLFHREDIGTSQLIKRRIQVMKGLRAKSAVL